MTPFSNDPTDKPHPQFLATIFGKKMQLICRFLRSITFSAYFGVCRLDCILFSSIVVQLPHEVQLNMSDTQECQFQHDYSGIQDDVIGNMGFLENFVDSPPVVMKTVRCIIVYLWEKDTQGEYGYFDLMLDTMKCSMEYVWGWPVLWGTSSKNVTLNNVRVLSTITF